MIEIVLTSYGSRVGSSPNFIVLNGLTGTVEWTNDIPGSGTEGVSIGDVDNDGCMEVVVVPDWTSSGGLRVFDSSVPISDCGTLSYDDGLNISQFPVGYTLLLKTFKGGITIYTGKDN